MPIRVRGCSPRNIGPSVHPGQPLGTDFLKKGQFSSNFSSEGSGSAGILLTELTQSKKIYKPPPDSWQREFKVLLKYLNPNSITRPRNVLLTSVCQQRCVWSFNKRHFSCKYEIIGF